MSKSVPTCILIVLALSIVTAAADKAEEAIRAKMGEINGQLEVMGEDVRIAVVEYYTAWEKAGQTVYFDDRVKQMGSHWVVGDWRRGGFWDIAWLSDLTEGTASGLTAGETQAAVDRAMATWDEVSCSTIPLVQLSDFGIDWGYVQYLVGYGGTFGWYADITHAGWLPGDFFDTLFGPGGSDYIIAATYTFVWVESSTGEYTDIDNNRKLDAALREIYYNNKFAWGIDPEWDFLDPSSMIIDVETIVLHETGHGLSQGHFGKMFKTKKNDKFHFAPQAVMNAGYTGVQQELTGTDNAGHCSIWGAWPNK